MLSLGTILWLTFPGAVLRVGLRTAGWVLLAAVLWASPAAFAAEPSLGAVSAAWRRLVVAGTFRPVAIGTRRGELLRGGLFLMGFFDAFSGVPPAFVFLRRRDAVPLWLHPRRHTRRGA